MLAIDLSSAKYCVETEYIKLMRGVNQGFTLIELMIAVAIIAVLVAVGVPQYQNYVARSQAIEGVNLAGGIKTALAEYYNINGVFPKDTTDPHVGLGLEPATSITGKYVTSVTVSDDGLGTITAEFGSGNHAGKFVRLTPVPVASGSIYFDCDSDIEESYRPKECVEGTSGPTALEIAQAALETANEALTIAESNLENYFASNNADWDIDPDTGYIDTTNWSSGLAWGSDEWELKIFSYYDHKYKWYQAHPDVTQPSWVLSGRNHWYNRLSTTMKTEYDSLGNVISDAAQAVADAQQVVTDLGG